MKLISRRLRRRRLLWTLAVPILLFALSCGDQAVQSKWRDREIVLDGIPDEWQGSRTYIESPNIALGAMNDETYLYVALATPVRSVASRILRQGLTVWFEPKGRGDRIFGVRCPMGMQGFKPMPGVGGDAGGADGGPGGYGAPDGRRDMGAPEDPNRIRELIKDAETRLEILGPGEDDNAILLNDGTHGIQVAMGYRDGNFGYEIKVPLAISGDRDYGIGGNPGKPIRVGFETPEINLEDRREGMPDRRPPGGDIADGPGESMQRGGVDGDGMRGGMRGGRLEAIKVWMSVTLAVPDGGED